MQPNILVQSVSEVSLFHSAWAAAETLLRHLGKTNANTDVDSYFNDELSHPYPDFSVSKCEADPILFSQHEPRVRYLLPRGGITPDLEYHF